VSNPLEDYLGSRPAPRAFTKEAAGGLSGFGSMAGNAFMEGGAQALGQGAVGLLAGGVGVAAMKAYQALRKRRDFKEMLAVNPDLAEHQAADPNTFNAHYNSLRTMNPGYAQDPIIAGTLMRRMSMHGPTAGSVLMESMESASKALPRGGQGPFSLTSKITDKGQETGAGFRF
jgi:hypothetical protein